MCADLVLLGGGHANLPLIARTQDIDAQDRTIGLDDGRTLPYDVMSVNTGSTIAPTVQIDGSVAATNLPKVFRAKPIHQMLELRSYLQERTAERLVVAALREAGVCLRLSERADQLTSEGISVGGAIEPVDVVVLATGVFAVRQGPILVNNVMATLEDGPDARLKRFSPGGAYLALLNLGDNTALFWRRILGFHIVCRSESAYRLKDRIDLAFMHRFGSEADRMHELAEGSETA